MAGLGMAATREALALDGGSKAVTFPDDRHSALIRWPQYGPAEKKALHDLIDSGRFYEELPLFEKEWQAYTKAPFVKAHMNCTSALTSMYSALDLEPGSEILVPSYTFFATCLPLRFFGLVPVFVDVDPKTVCFDLDDAKRKITPRTKALVVMHSWGMPCEMDHIGGWAKEKGLILMEDCAQAHGASMQGRKMGNWGVMGAYSFQASKVMPTVEGGIGMYQTREYFERAAAFGHYEDPPKFPAGSPVRAYDGTGFGQKYRMHPFAAAVGRQQLRVLDQQTAVVEANIHRLNDRLLHLPGLSEPRIRRDQKRAYYNGNMLFLDAAKAGFSRSALIKALQAEGVRASTWDYPEQHKFRIYSEAKWWHHLPVIPATMAGNAQVNSTHLFLPLMHGEAPELIEQYARAFEKVWAHRAALGKTS
ncbi:MAG TPA: DegT/DnrJ/EryC1/StrS family aminotransferase [Bryobacteraceae bacterium]|jgi:dTDP-4-amino-4,6-dideoxygalactose transaminase|nr:DegT/DnrJ/EryC1/StrS family aminotransferase [Bryobacteraceae bacterium]